MRSTRSPLVSLIFFGAPLAAGLLYTEPCPAQGGRVPVMPGRLPRWTDSRGQTWDPNYAGQINDGTGDTFDGGFHLEIQGVSATEFVRRQMRSPTGFLFMEENSLVMGPFTVSGVEVTQRMGLTPDNSGLRIVTSLSNPGKKTVSVRISYHHDLGSNLTGTVTTNKGAALDERDWGVAFHQNSSRNTVVHVFGSKRGRRKLEVSLQPLGGDVRLDFGSIEVPAGKTVSVAHFGFQIPAQSDPHAEVFDKFEPREALADLPRELRGTIINIGWRQTMVDIDIPRDPDADRVELLSGTVLKGKVLVPSLGVRSVVGEVSLPAARVHGIVRPEGRRGKVLLAATDGQVFAGPLLPAEIPFRLEGGKEVKVAARSVRLLAFRQDLAGRLEGEEGGGAGEEPVEPGATPGEEPVEAQATDYWVSLDTGDRFRLAALAGPLPFVSRYGEISLTLTSLNRLVLQDEGRSTHRLRLRNGTSVSGLVPARRIPATLADGREVELPTARVAWIGRRGEEGEVVFLPGVFRIETTSGDEIVGGLHQDRLAVITEVGELEVDTSEIKSMEVARVGSPAKVVLELWSGSRVQGVLGVETIEVDAGVPLLVDPLQCDSFEQPERGVGEAERREIEGLVRRLDDDDFSVRDKAEESLIHMGLDIRPYLRLALEDEGCTPQQEECIRRVLEALKREE